jgi:hypothetical protein
MSFRFDITKTTEVACELIRREGGVMNIMKMNKLVYALDRLPIQRRGIPVVGDTFVGSRASWMNELGTTLHCNFRESNKKR